MREESAAHRVVTIITVYSITISAIITIVIVIIIKVIVIFFFIIIFTFVTVDRSLETVASWQHITTKMSTTTTTQMDHEQTYVLLVSKALVHEPGLPSDRRGEITPTTTHPHIRHST